MRTLYLECENGAAGDMLSAALWELIDDKEGFIEEINTAGIPDVSVFAIPAVKCGVSGTHFKVLVKGHEEEALDIHEHKHEHEHEHEHHHSSLKDIENIINSLNVSQTVKTDAINIYKLIADAESKVHGTTVTDIHFHEVGAMDAIADIVSVAMLMEKLKPENVIASAVHTGKGKIECAHGILPIPAPATSLLLKGIPVYSTDLIGELCTPTGAALLKYYVRHFGAMPVMNIENIGYGMGTKDFKTANYLRAFIGESTIDPSVFAESQISDHHHHPVQYTAQQTKTIVNRLSRSIGHLESVKRMVEDNRDASDVLIQLSAVESAISSTARVIIKNHFKHSIEQACATGNDEDLDKLYGIVEKFIK